FVIAQLASQSSDRLPARCFDTTAMLYTALFVFAVLLPIWQLTSPTNLGARLSLSLGAIALVLLVPYLVSFKNKLDPDRILAYLYRKVLVAIGGPHDVEPVEARLIQSMTLSAQGVRDYE